MSSTSEIPANPHPCVWVTRPANQAGALSRILVEQGFDPYEIPMLEISAHKEGTHWVRQMLLTLEPQDLIVFVSTNAVRFFFQALKGELVTKLADTHWCAVGASTLNELEKFQFKHRPLSLRSPVNGERSEGLAELIIQVRGENAKVWLVQGNQTRGYLQSFMTTALIPFVSVCVYESRCPLRPSAFMHEAWQSHSPSIILTTSNAILSHLVTTTPDKFQDTLYNTPVMVVSHRGFHFAQELGFKQLFCAENTSNQAVIRALMYYYQDKNP